MDLEREILDLRRQISMLYARIPLVASAPQIRLAKTAEPAEGEGEYPSYGAERFPVIFQDTFDYNFTPRQAEAKLWANTLDKAYYPKNTPVILLWHSASWWILSSRTPVLQRFQLKTRIGPGADTAQAYPIEYGNIVRTDQEIGVLLDEMIEDAPSFFGRATVGETRGSIGIAVQMPWEYKGYRILRLEGPVPWIWGTVLSDSYSGGYLQIQYGGCWGGGYAPAAVGDPIYICNTPARAGNGSQDGGMFTASGVVDSTLVGATVFAAADLSFYLVTNPGGGVWPREFNLNYPGYFAVNCTCPTESAS